MHARGSVPVGGRDLSVYVEASGRTLHITGAHSGCPVSFEGRGTLAWRDRVANWFALSGWRRSAIRCLFNDISLQPAGVCPLLTIDPGWPWDEPLKIRIERKDERLLDEWNRAALLHLAGKDVRLDPAEGGFTITDVRSGTVRGFVQWDAIITIRAYKLDLFAYDMICVFFECSDGWGAWSGGKVIV